MNVVEIVNTPLLVSSQQDKLIRNFNKDDIYSMKSGYRLFMENLIRNEDRLHVVGDWKMLWNLQVPRKVRVFAWRACRDVLPT